MAAACKHEAGAVIAQRKSNENLTCRDKRFNKLHSPVTFVAQMLNRLSLL